MPPKLDLATVNMMPPQTFSAAFGRAFEHSPWVAERAFARRPFAAVDALHAAMVAVVNAATPGEQLALLRAHPDLAGREAHADTLTAESSAEQRQAGLNALTPEESARIADLNREHANKFGFPFIIAARLNSKAQIFAEFERRMHLSIAAEMRACLEQVFAISRLRVQDLIDDPQAGVSRSTF
jgi:2-oxo-4-hydroxy-4-carboxy-5-ureidoimidazoline decarboxylase